MSTKCVKSCKKAQENANRKTDDEKLKELTHSKPRNKTSETTRASVKESNKKAINESSACYSGMVLRSSNKCVQQFTGVRQTNLKTSSKKSPVLGPPRENKSKSQCSSKGEIISCSRVSKQSKPDSKSKEVPSNSTEDLPDELHCYILFKDLPEDIEVPQLEKVSNKGVMFIPKAKKSRLTFNLKTKPVDEFND